MAQLARDGSTLLARRRRPVAAAAPIDPWLVRRLRRLAEAVLLVATGMLAAGTQPDLARDPALLPAILAAVTLFAGQLLFRLPLGPREFDRDILPQPPLVSGLARIAWRTLLPFALLLALLAGLAAIDAAAAVQPLFGWLRLWGLEAVAAIAIVHAGFYLLINHWRLQGRFRRTVAIVGTGDLAERLIDRLLPSCAETVDIAGIFDDRARSRIPSDRQRRLFSGTLADLVRLSRQVQIDHVVIALPHAAEPRLLAILASLRTIFADISLSPDMVGYAAPARAGAPFDGLPLIELQGRPLLPAQRLAKNLFDRCAAFLGLLLLCPLFGVIALAIRLDSPGPVFFCQNRHGLGERVIRVFKFRSMKNEFADPGGARQTEIGDPRVTRVGRFLRRTSLDELPQLFNVLQGDMSLVGPRPLPLQMRIRDGLGRKDLGLNDLGPDDPGVVAEYSRRHHVKPGITGWAQVSGHIGRVATAEALSDRIAHDLYYIDHWSFLFDLRILLLTLKVVVRKEGAF